MVLPMGAGDALLDTQPAPDVVREEHSTWWWVLFTFLLFLAPLQMFAAYIFAALYTTIAAYVVWYMVKDSCKEMSPYFLMLVGLMSVIQCIFDTAILLTMIGGRKEQHTERTHYDQAAGEAEYRIKVSTHPFFDESMGPVYNMQSLSRLLSPMIWLVASVLSYKSYSAFEHDFLQGFGEAGPIAGVGAARFGGIGAAGGGYGGVAGGGAAAGRRVGGNDDGPAAAGRTHGGGATFAPFGGTGQRLGNDNA